MSLTSTSSTVVKKRTQNEALWNAYLKNPTERRHEALWRSYQPLVRHIADRFNEKMFGSFDLNALIDAGNVGLLDALAEFTPDATALFESIAVPMIRKAIARSLTVQRSKEKGHILRMELADKIVPENAAERAVATEVSLLKLGQAVHRAVHATR